MDVCVRVLSYKNNKVLGIWYNMGYTEPYRINELTTFTLHEPKDWYQADTPKRNQNWIPLKIESL